MKTICFLLIILYSATLLSQTETGLCQKVFLNTMHFRSQGQELDMAYVYERAAKPNGSTILLLHGKNFSICYWLKTVDYLSEKGYDVLVPDQIGFGRSSIPENYQHSFQQMAINTKKLIDTLNIENVIVVGHSMGGMLATRFSLMFPEKCAKLILENPIGLEDWKTKVPYSTIDEEYKKEIGKTREDLKQYMSKNYFHDQWKEEYEKLLNESTGLMNRPEYSAFAKSMALTSDMIFTQPVCYEFKNLKIPVVLIIGQADRTAIGKEKVPNVSMGNYPELGKKVATEIPKCKLIELKGIGHIPHIEDFDQFKSAMNTALND